MAKKKITDRKIREPFEPKAPADIWALPDGHHSAMRTGFDKMSGAVYPAPTHTAPMDAIRLDRQALSDFADVMNAHIHRELQKLARREDEWWKSVQDDLAIKRGDGVSYFYAERCFRRTEKPPAADA